MDQFIRACEDGDVECVREIISDRDFDVNRVKRVYVSSSGLFTAIDANRIDVVRLLLSHPNIDVNALNTSGWSPLQYAIRYANTADLEIIKMLLSHPNLDVNIKNRFELTPLMLVSMLPDNLVCNIIQLLLAHPKIDVFAEDNAGYTALDYAVMYHNEENKNMILVKMLSVIGQDVFIMSVPPNASDAITCKMIETGMLMVDFHGEREIGRYYMKKTYDALQQPKRNMMTRQPILQSDMVYYIADVISAHISTL